MSERERLIELLESAESAVYWNSSDQGFIQKIADHLLANGVTFQKWIPVSERLPSWNDGKVLVFTKYGFSICERTVNGRWKGQHANWITHWMPLPNPPEEDNK